MKISVTTRAGERLELECDDATQLMAVLAECDLVEAICGGECSCATCQVYVDPAWLGRLPPMRDDERMLLDDFVNTRPESRLACQIWMHPELDGLAVEVAPE